MSDGVRRDQNILGSIGKSHVDRRKLIRSGLQAGAALGVAGLAGLTLVGGPGSALAQEDPTIDPNAPEWEPAVEPRSPRKYRWEPWQKMKVPSLPGCKSAPLVSVSRFRTVS